MLPFLCRRKSINLFFVGISLTDVKQGEKMPAKHNGHSYYLEDTIHLYLIHC